MPQTNKSAEEVLREKIDTDAEAYYNVDMFVDDVVYVRHGVVLQAMQTHADNTAVELKEKYDRLDKECDLLHKCITELYNGPDVNVPIIQECLRKIKSLTPSN